MTCAVSRPDRRSAPTAGRCLAEREAAPTAASGGRRQPEFQRVDAREVRRRHRKGHTRRIGDVGDRSPSRHAQSIPLPPSVETPAAIEASTSEPSESPSAAGRADTAMTLPPHGHRCGHRPRAHDRLDSSTYPRHRRAFLVLREGDLHTIDGRSSERTVFDGHRTRADPTIVRVLRIDRDASSSRAPATRSRLDRAVVRARRLPSWLCPPTDARRTVRRPARHPSIVVKRMPCAQAGKDKGRIGGRRAHRRWTGVGSSTPTDKARTASIRREVHRGDPSPRFSPGPERDTRMSISRSDPRPCAAVAPRTSQPANEASGRSNIATIDSGPRSHT